MSFLTLSYPNSFLMSKIAEGKFSNVSSLVDVLEDFILENSPDTTILKKYYKNIVLKFYAATYNLASQGKTDRDTFFRDNSIFFFMHDFLSHIFYGHTVDVIGDQRVHEARNSLKVKYVPLEIIIKFFINRECFLTYLEAKKYVLSSSLYDKLDSFVSTYEEIVAEQEESMLLEVLVEKLRLHLSNEQELIEEINLVSSIISHEQNLRRVCVYQLFDEIKNLLEGVSNECLDINSVISQFDAAYQRISNVVQKLDFTAVNLNLDQVLALYDVDYLDYEMKRADIENDLFNIISSPIFVSKINSRLSVFEIPIKIPYMPVCVK